MNKSMFAVLLLTLSLTSCNLYDAVFGESIEEQLESVPDAHLVMEPDTTVIDTVKKPDVIPGTNIPTKGDGWELTEVEDPFVEPSPQNNNETVDYEAMLRKDSLTKAREANAKAQSSKYEAEKRRHIAEIERLKNANKPIILTRSTYKPLYPKAVERILYELQISYIRSMKIKKVASMMRPELLKLFTIRYCDDRMLEWLDNTVENNLRYISSSTRIDIDKCINNKAVEASEFIHISKSKKRR